MNTKEFKEDLRKRQLAQIHIAKKALHLDDETYRAVLMDVAGVNSSADLSDKGRRDVLARFESRGWKNKQRRGKSRNTSASKSPRMSKIGALLADMSLPWSYANGIVKQMYGITRVDWCNEEQLTGVIAALMDFQAKKHRQKRLEEINKQSQAT